MLLEKFGCQTTFWKFPDEKSIRCCFSHDGSTRRSTATHVSLRRCNSRSTRITMGRAGSITGNPPSPAPVNGGGGRGCEPPTETALVSLDCGGCIEARLLEPDEEIIGYASRVVQTKIWTSCALVKVARACIGDRGGHSSSVIQDTMEIVPICTKYIVSWTHERLLFSCLHFWLWDIFIISHKN